ncbi:MAG TPA: hypothetical protein DD490_05680, partial [Acidobacteria bacterium]|nr:hypothetical protein [Acidobacteriota bacterium]
FRAFDPERIAVAIGKALIASDGGQVLDDPRRAQVNDLARGVCRTLAQRYAHGGSVYIEEIQDQAE